MAYTVLARRYRSQSFDEVIGQDAVARTLRHAIDSDRVAHAYLFCGTRGVGKTSMARIFAKALNGGSEGVDTAIMTGQDTDVVEIDGASHNSVENARDLIANAVYKPLRGKHKIYIIDEVHMLSTAAFNALLKTMEEPPEHVKFILCTTEAHKVPATIQSRCQRFDFRPIAPATIASHVKEVIEREGRSGEVELVRAVARLANGSMRDALSILDRLMASGEERLTLAGLEDLLGLPDREWIARLIRAFAGGEPGAALTAGDELLRQGVSIDQGLEALLDRLRDLMVLGACGPETDLVDVAAEARAGEVELAGSFDPAGLMHMIALIENVQRSAKSSAAPRALFDALLVRLAMTEKLADVTSLATGSSAMSSASQVGGAAPAPVVKKNDLTRPEAGARARGVEPARVEPARATNVEAAPSRPVLLTRAPVIEPPAARPPVPLSDPADAQEHPLVRQAAAALGAKVVGVELKERRA